MMTECLCASDDPYLNLPPSLLFSSLSLLVLFCFLVCSLVWCQRVGVMKSVSVSEKDRNPKKCSAVEKLEASRGGFSLCMVMECLCASDLYLNLPPSLLSSSLSLLVFFCSLVCSLVWCQRVRSGEECE